MQTRYRIVLSFHEELILHSGRNARVYYTKARGNFSPAPLARIKCALLVNAPRRKQALLQIRRPRSSRAELDRAIKKPLTRSNEPRSFRANQQNVHRGMFPRGRESRVISFHASKFSGYEEKSKKGGRETETVTQTR